MSDPAPSDVIVGAHCPLYALTDWLMDGGPELATFEDYITHHDIRKEAWELINVLSSALDAHVAAHPGDEWAQAWQASIASRQ